jgi:hypothetical protein
MKPNRPDPGPPPTDLVTALCDHLAGREGLARVARQGLGGTGCPGGTDQAGRARGPLPSAYPGRGLGGRGCADTDPDAVWHRAQVTADQLTACRRVARQLADEGILAKPWTADSAAGLVWALLSSDLITRLTVTCRWVRPISPGGCLCCCTAPSPPAAG